MSRNPRARSTGGKKPNAAARAKGKSAEANVDDALKKLGGANNYVCNGETLNTSMLEYHNQLRSEHKSAPLEVSEELVKWARLTVADCASQDKQVTYHCPRDCGLNIWEYKPHESSLTERYATYMAAHALQVWYAEMENWDWENCGAKKLPKLPKGAPKRVVRNFAQVVWQATTNVGCAVSKSPSGTWYVACMYSPAGNIIRSYRRNVPPVGGHDEAMMETWEAEEAAVVIQSAARGRAARGGGLIELRAVFHVGGKIDVFDDDLGTWFPGKIVQMGGGRTIAEYSTPTQSGIQKEIHIGDANIRATTASKKTRKDNDKDDVKLPPIGNSSRHSPNEHVAQKESAAARRQRMTAINDAGVEIVKEQAGLHGSVLMSDVNEDRGLSALGLFDTAVDNAPAELYERTKTDRVATIFREWDEDGSGCISTSELADVFCHLGWPDERIQCLFFNIDKNQDGTIDFEEFLAWLDT